jgi:RNA polymerase sigma-70 factor (ECF subfamily)
MDTRFSAETDEELFARIGTQDGEAAFRALYSRHAPRLYAYCARIVGNRDDAKDLFQETFIRMHQQSKAQTGPVRVAPLMYTIARNLCISQLRGRKQTVSAETAQLATKDVPFEHTERALLVQRAIEALPFPYREALVLREYDDFSYADIAEIMNIPVATVKVRIFRAKERMRNMLAPFIQEA